jgi:hypothetical protein
MLKHRLSWMSWRPSERRWGGLEKTPQLVQTFYFQKAIYEGRGPCRLYRWLVPHILGRVVGGQNDREPSYRLARN